MRSVKLIGSSFTEDKGWFSSLATVDRPREGQLKINGSWHERKVTVWLEFNLMENKHLGNFIIALPLPKMWVFFSKSIEKTVIG